MKLKTWHVEASVVALLLTTSTYLLTPNRMQDWLATLAVQVTFHYVSVGTRLQEAQKRAEHPDVECFRWLSRYLFVKEALWVATFVLSGLYPPLVGSFLFLLYPYWRHLWRKRHPVP